MDSIRYRIPGEEQKEEKGIISEINNPIESKGIVLSNFDQSIWYSIQLDKSVKQTFGSKPIPVVISKDDYLKQANDFIQTIKEKQLGKAVFSRVKKIEHNNKSNWFEVLCEKYPTAFVYELKSEILGHWLGATPEVLLEVNEGKGKTMSLAGTLSINTTDEWSEKEFIEQQLVTSFIEENLKPYVTHLKIASRKEVNTGVVRHLMNEFTFEIAEKQVSKVIANLHPTPAVSGYPRLEAMNLIEASEKHVRSLYAGVIGFLNPLKTNLYVNLRSCQIIDDHAYLYLGGGFTKDSIAEKEWQETENKAKTLLNILQNT